MLLLKVLEEDASYLLLDSGGCKGIWCTIACHASLQSLSLCSHGCLSVCVCVYFPLLMRILVILELGPALLLHDLILTYYNNKDFISK
jgi:hypothetical protein